MVSLQYPEMKVPGISLENQIPPVPSELAVGVPVFVAFVKPFDAKGTESWLQPQPFTLWTQFLTFQQEFQQATGWKFDYLADALQGFFDNGGRVCYVYLIQTNFPIRADELIKGLEALETLSAVDLVCIPGLIDFNLQVMVLKHCQAMGDRFAILDAANDSVEVVQRQRAYLSQAGSDLDCASYGGLYYPWLKIESAQGLKPVPPCGHIAGTYARRDRVYGVHHAPANAALEGVLDLTVNLSNLDQTVLSPSEQVGVNCIRAFRGRGIRVWGACTLSQNPQWQHINVRRLFITVGRWINFHLAGVTFEPNDPALWIRLERELGVYCESLWRRGALKGATATEGFYVYCNAETNPPELRQMGQVGVELGLAPTVPGEFIRVSLIHGETGVTLSPS
jgi:hypothetical protein